MLSGAPHLLLHSLVRHRRVLVLSYPQTRGPPKRAPKYLIPNGTGTQQHHAQMQMHNISPPPWFLRAATLSASFSFFPHNLVPGTLHLVQGVGPSSWPPLSPDVQIPHHRTRRTVQTFVHAMLRLNFTSGSLVSISRTQPSSLSL